MLDQYLFQSNLYIQKRTFKIPLQLQNNSQFYLISSHTHFKIVLHNNFPFALKVLKIWLIKRKLLYSC